MTEQKEHCWHPRGVSGDFEKCCYCDVIRYHGGSMVGPEGHGPNHPDAQWMTRQTWQLTWDWNVVSIGVGKPPEFCQKQ